MKELEAIRKLAPKWRTAEWQWPKNSSAARGPVHCADELEALLPDERTAKLEVEIALREPMSCGHPRACWQATTPDSIDAVVGYRCVACEDKQLAVAAALREAADDIAPPDLHNHPFELQHSLCWQCINAKKVLALISPADSQALDAHDADTRSQALEEACKKLEAIAHEKELCAGNSDAPESYTQALLSDVTTLRSASRELVRALKRDKRGGE